MLKIRKPFNIYPTSSQSDRPSPLIRKGRRLEILIAVNTVHLPAIPDTESLWNAMDETIVKKLRLAVSNKSSDSRDFTIGNGTKIISIGRVTVGFSFANEKMKALKASFYVFSKITTNVALILGRDFLDTTETLTKHTHRLRERMDLPKLAPSFNSIGTSCRRFWCYLDLEVVLASADTGSDINIISPAYAVERRFNLQPLDESDPKYVEFPGGSVMSLSGKITARLDTMHIAVLASSSGGKTVETLGNALDVSSANSKAAESRARSTNQCFYILWDLHVPLILGQKLLDSIAAFTNHYDDFVEVEEPALQSEMNTIQVASRISSAIKKSRKNGVENIDQAEVARGHLVENDAVEMHRQERIAKEISQLEKLEESASDLADKQRYKQQKEDLAARNTSQVSLYTTERAKAEDEIAKLCAATRAT